MVTVSRVHKQACLTRVVHADGNMVALRDDKIVPVPLSEVAGKLKTVPPDCEIVAQARALGLSMGD